MKSSGRDRFLDEIMVCAAERPFYRYWTSGKVEYELLPIYGYGFFIYVRFCRTCHWKCESLSDNVHAHNMFCVDVGYKEIIIVLEMACRKARN